MPSDAMVDGNFLHLFISKSSSKSLSLIIPTLQELESLEIASMINPRVRLRLRPTPMFLNDLPLNSLLPLISNQSLWPLMPMRLSSSTTQPVFWIPLIAEPNSITPLPPLDTEPPKTESNTISWEILGVLPGETKDISKSQLLTELVFAVSNLCRYTHLLIEHSLIGQEETNLKEYFLFFKF